MQAPSPMIPQPSRATTGPPTSAAGVDMTDLEPSDDWKNDLLKRIQGELAFVVKDAKNQLQENIRRNPETRDILLADHRSIMDNLHRLAEEEFWEELEWERQERSWAMGVSSRIDSMDPSLREEQESIYHQIVQSERGPLPDRALNAAYRGPQEQAAELRRSQQTIPEPTAAQTSRTVPLPPIHEIPPLPPNMTPPPLRLSASASSSSSLRVPTIPIREHPYYRRDYNYENGRKDPERGAATSKTTRVALGGMDPSITAGSGRPLAAQPTLHTDESKNSYQHSAPFGRIRRPVEDQSFRRAFKIEEKRKSGETDRQRAEKEREMEHRKGAKEEENRLGRIKREQESRRLDEERERRRLRKVHQAAPLRAAGVDITKLESSNANGAREEWSARLRKERKEQEEARRLDEESEHKQILKEAQQGLDYERPAAMRPQLGEAANGRLGGFDNARTTSALSYYPSRMPVLSTRLAPSTSRSINRPSTVEQHHTAYLPPTGSVKGKVASPPPPKIRDPQELHRLKGESEQKKPRVAQQGERDKQPERELEREREPGQGREPEKRESEREREIEPPREKEKEELEAQMSEEQDGENRETEKSLKPLEEAGEKVEDAPKLALQAESKQLTEEQPESSKLDHQMEEEADKLESETSAEHREVEGQHKQPLEPQPAQRKYEQNEEMPAATVQLERGERDGVNVPVLELTKQWKATLKSRIDEEIGIIGQLNAQWFEENISKVKEDDQLHLQTELENVTRSLDLLRSLALEMLSGDVAEMVILVERESKGEGEAVSVDIAEKAKREYREEGTAMCVQVPGPKTEPPAIDPGRTEEDSESPGIEPGTDAEAPARNNERLEKDVEGPAKDTREPTKNTEELTKEDTGNGEAMQLETSKNVFTPKPKGGRQRMSPLADAHHFVIHHATFINSETANIFTPTHGR
ncbi:hypothetical protein EST38_g3111 [Candolleomyces aberdarensis]|uniref:Uncharacterized protein n=1 Tax=Candolleomyces aberdarensis TaxID=2316362 RepID=A0A4Q2DTU9_9AGAR|nr:hypothetical protein EST38_g3111 [Candolleomyces aberdarensis]